MLVFGNIFSFPGVNWAQNGPKHHFWICLISALIRNFERLFRDCLFLMKDYLWLKFQQTQAIFEGEIAQKSPKSSHLMDAASP